MPERLRRLAGRAWRTANRMLSRGWLARRLRPGVARLERLGEGHAAWWVPEDIAPGAIAYCGGVGLDATYDFALVERKRLEVHSFDPTPAAIAFMERENRGRVRCHPWGLMDRDGTMRFHAPFDATHANWFAENLHGTQETFAAECLTIPSVMARLGHARIDLLKLDIEGSWFAVVPAMLAAGVRPPTLCIEFDSPAPLARVRQVVLALETAGYALAARDGDNAAFVLTAGDPA